MPEETGGSMYTQHVKPAQSGTFFRTMTTEGNIYLSTVIDDWLPRPPSFPFYRRRGECVTGYRYDDQSLCHCRLSGLSELS